MHNAAIDTIIPESEQQGILALAALNRVEKGKYKEIHKVRRICGLAFSFRYRSSKMLMGRFGGGWQWALGFEVGGTGTVNLNLLVCSVMIHRYKKEVENIDVQK